METTTVKSTRPKTRVLPVNEEMLYRFYRWKLGMSGAGTVPQADNEIFVGPAKNGGFFKWGIPSRHHGFQY
jgi:hypothetical protein